MTLDRHPTAQADNPSPERGCYIFTFTGEDYFPFDPRAEEVSIRNITRSLAMQPRFNGMLARFYSVAEHSVVMSRQVAPEFAREALLHDATEHVHGDLLNPIKKGMSQYRELEAINDLAIRDRFKLPPEMSPEIIEADQRMFATEIDQVLSEACAAQVKRRKTAPLADPYPILLEGWGWQHAEHEFRRRCIELGIRIL
jgi:hypothetical protein